MDTSIRYNTVARIDQGKQDLQFLKLVEAIETMWCIHVLHEGYRATHILFIIIYLYPKKHSSTVKSNKLHI